MSVLVPVPSAAPRMGTSFTRWIGYKLLCLLGWKIEGELPNEKKMVIALAPHTSNWDFILAVSTILSLGLKISFLMKKEAFIWPLTYFHKSVGAIPTDRQAASGIVDQVVSWFHTHERVWVAIAPEGTRKKVPNWKTGFIRIAHAAQVPVLLATMDYPSKTIRLCKVVHSSGNHTQDADDMKAYIDANFTARHPKYQ